MFIIDDIINAITGSNAASQQAQAAQKALDLQKQQYEQQRSDQAPWLSAGQGSLADLMKLSQDPSSIANSPGYQFRMQQGQQALERSAAAKGGLASGGFMKGLDRYSQGLASDEYGNRWNQLMGVAQMGQGTAQNLGSLGANYANSASNLYGAQGNANAAGTMAVGNGIAGGVRSLGNLAMLGMGGGLSALGIPGMGGVNPGASPVPASTGYIPRQQSFGLPQLSYGGG